jgi:hypothetical protein
MKPIAAALTNWFLPGLGYLILGKKIPLAIAWMVALVGLTYVEFGIKVAAPEYYLPMFGSVLLMNTAFAVDAWMTAKEE